MLVKLIAPKFSGRNGTDSIERLNAVQASVIRLISTRPRSAAACRRILP